MDLLDLELTAQKLVAERVGAHRLRGGFDLGAILGDREVLELCHFG